MASPVLRIAPGGNIGNQMLQYMFALSLQTHRPDARIVGHQMPMWGLADTADVPVANTRVELTRSHRVPFPELVALVKRLDDFELTTADVHSRFAYYHSNLPLYRRVFAASADASPSHANDEIVINIRLGDIANGYHPNYFPLPLSFYHRIVSETGLRPLFMGQLGTDDYSNALRQQFPKATFITSQGPAKDFDFMRRSRCIIPSISTFAWLATWLSTSAEAIYFPIAGIYHPLHRADIDLLPVGDNRYRFYLSDKGAWTGPGELAGIISGANDFAPATHAQLRRWFPHLGTDGVTRRRPWWKPRTFLFQR